MHIKNIVKFAGVFLLSGAIFVTSGCNNSSVRPITDIGEKAHSDETTFWYNQPSEVWNDALPIGNGRMGAMVYGKTEDETIQINEGTVWSGLPHDYNREGGSDRLPMIRQALFDGDQKKAESLSSYIMMGDPKGQESYQPFCDLKLHFDNHNNVTDYKRTLDMNTAVASVSYSVNNVRFQRDTFASYPHQVIATRISADKPGQINLSATLQSLHRDCKIKVINDHEIALQGSVSKDKNAIKFEARLLIKLEGGSVTADNSGIKITGADAATLEFFGATNFVNYKDVSADPGKRCDDYVNAVKDILYEELKNAHLKDYQNLFNRVNIHLNGPDINEPTDKRIKDFNGDNDFHLQSLYFNYGRYLMIEGSRPGGQPLNLQGVWNDSMNPAWDSKYTVNINTEMNYWMAEPANLSECETPLLDMIKDVSETGTETAKKYYNAQGWVLHHNTDLWRGTAPVDNPSVGLWPVGGAWLTEHLYDYYQYTGDKAFLRDKAYPIMKQAVLFFTDYLVQDPKTGWLISTPSNSPEHGGIVAGPTMDHQIIRGLFNNCIQASKILGVDEDFRKTLQDKVQKIAPNQIGKWGQLQEWLEDKDNPKDTHKHVSHLWSLFPGNEITKTGTPDLFNAAVTSLTARGDGDSGWGKAWRVNLWANAGDGDKAYKILTDLIKNNSYTNLFDMHPPFQIDGNFGGASGIIEMLLQSDNNEISILPALPSAWPDGNISGLRAMGGYELNIKWKDHKLEKADIISLSGNSLPTVRVQGEVVNAKKDSRITFQKINK